MENFHEETIIYKTIKIEIHEVWNSISCKIY